MRKLIKLVEKSKGRVVEVDMGRLERERERMQIEVFLDASLGNVEGGIASSVLRAEQYVYYSFFLVSFLFL